MSFYDAGTIDPNTEVVLNFHYQIATFSNDYQAYQEIDANGNAGRFLDMQGNTILAPTTEYHITNTFPERPSWGT